MQTHYRVPEAVEPASFRSLAESFRRTLFAENKSPRTVATYSESLTGFQNFLTAQGMPGDPTRITREHVEAFIAFLLERFKPATAVHVRLGPLRSPSSRPHRSRPYAPGYRCDAVGERLDSVACGASAMPMRTNSTIRRAAPVPR